MALTPEIRAPQGGALTIYTMVTAEIHIPQAQAIVIYNVPAEEVRATVAGGIVTYLRQSQQLRITQAQIMAVARGRISNPRLRAWTFTLDGHDFYVLRLGDESTLLYDVYSEQWIEWTSADLPFWRANTGQNWIGAEALAQTHGSNVIVGDDTYGLLWFLDPEMPYDQHPDYLNPAQQIPFPRIVTGQVMTTGRQRIPCYAVFLSCDNYGLAGVEFTPTVLLETSDDQGRTFDAHDIITVPVDYLQDLPYEWLSLGQISEPGRIFRVTDNGALARIDKMDMNDNAG